MIIACPECNVNYRLDPRLLGAEGRRVLCTECRHSWHQGHVEVRDMKAIMAEAQEEEPEALPQAPMPTPAPPTMEQSFEEILKQTAALVETPAASIPEAVMPAPLARIAAPRVYRPVNMGPVQHGALAFCCCLFVTLIGLFLGKGRVVALWPPADLLYRTLGVHVPAPGEGLRIDALTAENRVDKGGRVLVIGASLVNMTDRPAPHPALRLRLASAYGAELKSWTLDNEGAKALAPGESVPVKLELKDAPEGGADIELEVVKP